MTATRPSSRHRSTSPHVREFRQTAPKTPRMAGRPPGFGTGRPLAGMSETLRPGFLRLLAADHDGAHDVPPFGVGNRRPKQAEVGVTFRVRERRQYTCLERIALLPGRWLENVAPRSAVGRDVAQGRAQEEGSAQPLGEPLGCALRLLGAGGRSGYEAAERFSAEGLPLRPG